MRWLLSYLHTDAAFLLGIVISFMGALPLGTLNITALHLSATQGWWSALQFSAAAVFIEMLAAAACIWGAQRLPEMGAWKRYLTPVAVVVLLLLAAQQFWSAPAASHSIPVLYGIPWVLGLTMSAVNPMQFPFWMGWTTTLTAAGKLTPGRGQYTWYIAGIAVGSMLSFVLFIWLGRVGAARFQAFEQALSWVAGGLYLGFAVYLLGGRKRV
jgi:threonine/homoserine/homoserine lactone efflux protein